MAKNRTFLKMGLTDEFQTKFPGFSIQFGYRNCKNLKGVLQLNWNIDAVYCGLCAKSSHPVSDDYDENYDPYAQSSGDNDDDDDEDYRRDIKPDVKNFDFKVPSSKAKKKRGRPKKDSEEAEYSPKKPRKPRKRKVKHEMDDFIDYGDDYGDFDKDWDGDESAEEVTKIKTEDGKVIEVPKKKKADGRYVIWSNCLARDINNSNIFLLR